MSINYEYCYKHQLRSKNHNLSNPFEPPNDLQFHQTNHNHSMNGNGNGNGNSYNNNIITENVERPSSSSSSSTSMVDDNITIENHNHMVRSSSFHPSSSDNNNMKTTSKLQRLKKRLSSHFECFSLSSSNNSGSLNHDHHRQFSSEFSDDNKVNLIIINIYNKCYKF